jgi:hypothetical protein
MRKALVSLCLGTTLIGTVSTLAPAALAAPATSSAVAAPMDNCPCNPPPGGGWQYVDSYFWGSSCDAAGRRLVNGGRFTEYKCTGGGTWSYYELWVR